MLNSEKKLPLNPLSNVAEVELNYKSNIKACDRLLVKSSKDAYDALMLVYDLNKIELKEFFWVLFLNRANRVLGAMLVGMGGLTGTVVDIRNIFQGALLANACNIILSHNHPSGNTKPSDADKNITRRLCDAGKLLDIDVVDHVIITGNDGYFSFADEGLL